MADALTVSKPKRGRPFKARPIEPLPPDQLALQEPNRDKQAANLRYDAYQFGRLLGNKIRIKLRDNDEKGLRELVWSWGVSVDKVLGGAEASGLQLVVPTALLEKLVLALNKPRVVPQTELNQLDTSLHNRTLSDTVTLSEQIDPTASVSTQIDHKHGAGGQACDAAPPPHGHGPSTSQTDAS